MAASELGKIHIITGRGKGKTTAAFGLAMRAAGHGLQVCIIQFMKTGETTGEAVSARRLKGIELVQFGTGRFVDPEHIDEADRAAARDALEYLRKRVSAGGCDILILDEVNVAAAFGLVRAGDVLKIIRMRGKGVEVIMTGREAPEEFIRAADYVSSIEDTKHPFTKGLKSRKGVEW